MGEIAGRQGTTESDLSDIAEKPASIAYPPPRKHDGDIKKIDDFLNLVMEQDCRICEVNQKGLHSNRFEHGVLVPQEYEVRNFQQWVLRELGEC